MLAVHFGAGNIGRGFIGALLSEAGYQMTFVDVNQTLIDQINQDQTYDVVLASEEAERIQVSNIQALNNLTHPDAVKEAITEADLVTTAIGPSILPKIAPLLAEGLELRLTKEAAPLSIIACENMTEASSYLETEVTAHISEGKLSEFHTMFGFPNAAVDRIAPDQSQEGTLDVHVEPYFEWVVETASFKGEKPKAEGITFVDTLLPYIERKLFTVNTGHIVPAYLGHYLGYDSIGEAMQDERVTRLLKGVLNETGEALIGAYGFKRKEQEAYIQTIIERFMNPHISDFVTRVGRNPIRKLGPKDRLIYPAKMYLDYTEQMPKFLPTLIALAFVYDYSEDVEAMQIKQMQQEIGTEKTLTEITGLVSEDLLVKVILAEIEQLQ